MTVSIPSAWHLRLANLRNQHPSRMRDIALSHLVDEDFDADDEKNIKELLLSFTSDIDTSLLQSFENALGRVDHRRYFLALGRCYQTMMAINPKVATERINYPSRELVGTETKEAFDPFVSCLDSVELLEPMRRMIVEWRLRGSEPYRAFFYLSQLVVGDVHG
ncbi:hypothetical protein NMA58_25560 (plasmid) [Rhizobium sp. YTUHZ045]|uniref:hypothetical protein n=1 Tax=Rhizobium sp. YTUHZ045 TaxID=2962888 RepID=UPI003DAA12B2